MKLRFKIAMLTVGGMLGLGLAAFLANGVHEGIANAQRANIEPAEIAETALTPFYAQTATAPVIETSAYDDNTPIQPVEPTRGGATLRAQNNRWNTTTNNQPSLRPSVSSSQPIVVAIKDGPQLSGNTVNLGAIQFKTIFGMVSIPVETIAGLRMGDESRQSATVCLTNGDSLTGTLITDSVTIKTAWGGATITRDQIVSIVTTTEPVIWQPHEGRWKIIVAAPVGSEKDAAAEEGIDDGDAADEPPTFDPVVTPKTSGVSPLQLDPDSRIVSET